MRIAASLVLVGTIFAACTSAGRQMSPRDDPLLAMLRGDRQTMARIGGLLAASGFSRLGERGAFIVNTDQGFAWIPWSDGGDFHHVAFRGKVPSRCLAVIHTHPISIPDPSPGDRHEAKRLGLPIVAVTPRSLAVVWPDGDQASLPIMIDEWHLTFAERRK